MEMIARSVDHLEMQGRRKILLLHGVAEENKEDTALVVTDVVKAHFNLSDFKVSEIKRCHRMGRSSDQQKPRPILFKLHDVTVRDTIWFSKTKLKGTGITVSEFLTKARHDLFMAARERLGVSKCWTEAGVVFALGSDGSPLRINSFAELNVISQPKTTNTKQVLDTSILPPIVTADVAASRPKRAATMKK